MSNAGELPVTGGEIIFPVIDTVMANNVDRFAVGSEEALFLRYNRRRQRSQELVFEFTRDPALLHQYFELIESECRTIPQFRAADDEFSRKGHIMVVRKGSLCVGGARLYARTPRQPKPLFMELAGFKLADHFPELELKQMRYGELSRLVLLPEFRSGEIAQQMFFHLYRKSVALDLDRVFAAAPKSNVRAYRRHFIAIGLKETEIHNNIEIPPDPGFEEVRDYLFSVKIDKSLIPEMQKTIPVENAIRCVEEV